MSIRDGMNFEKWFEEWMNGLEPEESLRQSMKAAYEGGFYDGVKAAKDYDPRWDAD